MAIPEVRKNKGTELKAARFEQDSNDTSCQRRSASLKPNFLKSSGRRQLLQELHRRILQAPRVTKMASDKPDKCQRNSKIVVTTRWRRTKEMPPAFGRLMALLLEEGTGHVENYFDPRLNRLKRRPECRQKRR